MTDFSVQLQCNSIDQAYRELTTLARLHGKPRQIARAGGLATVDCPNTTVVLTNPRDRQVLDANRKLLHRYQAAEFAWYMTGSRDVEVIAKYLPNWRRFAKGGKVNSNYGFFILPQMPKIMQLLLNDPGTRQAVIAIYSNSFLGKQSLDVPCTSSIAFSISEGDDFDKLNMHVTMRSNDIYYGFPIDAFCFTMFQELLSNTLDLVWPKPLQLGQYSHHAWSMHQYCNKLEVGLASQNNDLPRHDLQLKETTTLANFWFAKDPFFFDFVDFQHFNEARTAESRRASQAISNALTDILQ